MLRSPTLLLLLSKHAWPSASCSRETCGAATAAVSLALGLMELVLGAHGRRAVLEGRSGLASGVSGPFTPLPQSLISWSNSAPERPSASRREVGAQEGACLRSGPRAWEPDRAGPGSAPQISGDPAPAHLPPSAAAVGGQSGGQRGQRQQQRSGNPAGQQRPVPHGLPGLARSAVQLGRLWLLPATVGRDAAAAAAVELAVWL